MTPWNEKEMVRFTKRLALFVRRGLPTDSAERVADRLVRRDQEQDDRRMCIECSRLQQAGTCFAAQQGWIHGAVRRFTPVIDLLQRCEHFEFQIP